MQNDYVSLGRGQHSALSLDPGRGQEVSVAPIQRKDDDEEPGREEVLLFHVQHQIDQMSQIVSYLLKINPLLYQETANQLLTKPHGPEPVKQLDLA